MNDLLSKVTVNNTNSNRTANTSFDALIIGGGIIGCACAASLAQAGLRVGIIEPSTIGGGTTAAGMGHLVVMDDNPAELALSRYSLELWRQLVHTNEHEPAKHEYSECGTIWVAADEEEVEAARAKLQVLQAHEVRCELLSASQLAQREPQLRAGLAGGLLVHQDALVYPPKSAQLLLNIARKHGAHLIKATVVEVMNQAVRLEDGSEIEASNIVVANGLASTKLIGDLPLRYKKGHLLITDRYPQFIRHQLVELGYIKSAHASDGDSVAFNLQPRPTGQVFIGSSRQFDVTHKDIDHAILGKMLAQACHYVPSLANLKGIRAWTGFRAATPDGLPYIGPHPSRQHVWMATGHEGLGITTSLATAQILKDQICRQSSKIAVEAYWPTRNIQAH